MDFGPILAGIGLLLIIIGIGSFFASFGSFQPPRFFWCAFLGMPFLFVGLVLCGFGFQGAVLRYQLGEVAPVTKDTFNYLAEGTQEGMKTVATTIGEGIAAGMSGSGHRRIVVPSAATPMMPMRSSVRTAVQL